MEMVLISKLSMTPTTRYGKSLCYMYFV